MGHVQPFLALGKADAARAGGKGASLGEMTRVGIPVPPGFVLLSSAFERFLEETDLNIEIDAILESVDAKALHTVEAASGKIQELILAKEVPEEIRNEALGGFKELGAEYVAVRSSATAEDGASAAWAGQLDTFLNTTEAELLSNVRKCWASLFTPRAIFYRFEKGLESEKISVAVVVQKMIDSDAAGIAFSVHPVTEDRNQLIIEAAVGLGEAVVSGQITPDAYVVTKDPLRILDKNLVEQDRALYRKKGGGNEWRQLSPEKGREQELSDAQILDLARLVMRIETHYGFPVDVEWALEKGSLYITQSRPITTLSAS
ncbi:MAG: PEP/pyruvate-binding domain-containing protein [Patescibacteria group bacterium]|nr:PEP/pyruvate-binding domain-containing protein [Patescibacteria group bacterium]